MRHECQSMVHRIVLDIPGAYALYWTINPDTDVELVANTLLSQGHHKRCYRFQLFCTEEPLCIWPLSIGSFSVKRRSVTKYMFLMVTPHGLYFIQVCIKSMCTLYIFRLVCNWNRQEPPCGEVSVWLSKQTPNTSIVQLNGKDIRWYTITTRDHIQSLVMYSYPNITSIWYCILWENDTDVSCVICIWHVSVMLVTGFCTPQCDAFMWMGWSRKFKSA